MINVIEALPLSNNKDKGDSRIVEDQATSVAESEKEDTKSVELPAIS